MMEDTNRKYFSLFKGVLGLILICFVVILFIVLSSCNVFRELKKDEHKATSDSANVKKETEVASSVDTSKSKSASSKETIYYPQPIYIQGKDGKTEVVFVPQSTKETGTEEKQNFNFDNYRRDLLDSIRMAQLESRINKQTETKGSLLGMSFWIGISAFVLVLIVLLLVVLHFKNQIVSIKSLIQKSSI